MNKILKIEKLPKEVLEKAVIIGNVFHDLEENKRLLSKIEEIVGGDFCSNMEFTSAMGREFKQEEAKEMERVIGKIYRLVHSHNKDNCCYDTHQSWRDELTNPLLNSEKK